MDLLFSDGLKQGVLLQAGLHPYTQLLDVSNRVYNPSHLQHVCVLIEELDAEHSPAVVLLLEMGIGEQKEHLGELALFKVVGYVFHGVGADDGDVVVVARVGGSEALDPVFDILGDLYCMNGMVR